MSVRKSSHGTIFLIVSSGSPRALIASSLRSTSKKPVCPMTRSLHPPMTAHDHRVRFVATWREEFFEVPFSNLLRNPFGGRVRGHVNPDKLAPSQPNNDQNVQQVKADGRDYEQVHGRDLRHMVAQECAPALTRRAAVRAG